jgi:hypothetical protein
MKKKLLPRQDPMRPYLEKLELQELDLSNIDLEEENRQYQYRAILWQILALFLLIFLPQTEFWWDDNEVLFWVWSILIAAVGFSFAQTLFALAPSILESSPTLGKQWMFYAFKLNKLLRQHTYNKNPKSLQRWLFGGSALICAGVLFFFLPRQAEFRGQTYSGGWFFAVLLAIATGIFVGRWLLSQEPVWVEEEEEEPIPLPPPWWRKWLVLLMIIGLASTTFLDAENIGLDSRFPRSLAGFLAGILAAIWLGQRFDEMENTAHAHQRLHNVQRSLKERDLD